jgi:hypothetical protein
MRAERVEHLVVLRAHRLPPQPLAVLADLATATGTALWLVWHAIGPPAAGLELRMRVQPGPSSSL